MNGLWGRVATAVAVGCLVAAVAACTGFKNAAQKNQRQRQLTEIGIMYHNYHDTNNKGPSGPQDLQPFAQDLPEGWRGLQSGQIVVLWDVKMTEQLEGTSNTVLAYESDVPNGGGLVLMADGAVRSMNPQEFAAAPKAKPKKR